MITKKKKTPSRTYHQPFKNDLGGKYKMFLVRWCDSEGKVIKMDGPFQDEEKALATVNSYLKDGICSWLVSYND